MSSTENVNTVPMKKVKSEPGASKTPVAVVITTPATGSAEASPSLRAALQKPHSRDASQKDHQTTQSPAIQNQPGQHKDLRVQQISPGVHATATKHPGSKTITISRSTPSPTPGLATAPTSSTVSITKAPRSSEIPQTRPGITITTVTPTPREQAIILQNRIPKVKDAISQMRSREAGSSEPESLPVCSTNVLPTPVLRAALEEDRSEVQLLRAWNAKLKVEIEQHKRDNTKLEREFARERVEHMASMSQLKEGSQADQDALGSEISKLKQMIMNDKFDEELRTERENNSKLAAELEAARRKLAEMEKLNSVTCNASIVKLNKDLKKAKEEKDAAERKFSEEKAVSAQKTKKIEENATRTTELHREYNAFKTAATSEIAAKDKKIEQLTAQQGQQNAQSEELTSLRNDRDAKQKKLDSVMKTNSKLCEEVAELKTANKKLTSSKKMESDSFRIEKDVLMKKIAESDRTIAELNLAARPSALSPSEEPRKETGETSMNLLKNNSDLFNKVVQQLTQDMKGLVGLIDSVRIDTEKCVSCAKEKFTEAASFYDAELVRRAGLVRLVHDQLECRSKELTTAAADATEAAVEVTKAAAASATAEVTKAAAAAAEVTKAAALAKEVTKAAAVASKVTKAAAVAGVVTKAAAVADEVTKAATVAGEVTKAATVAPQVTKAAAVAADVSKVAAVAAEVCKQAAASVDVTAAGAVDTTRPSATSSEREPGEAEGSDGTDEDLMILDSGRESTASRVSDDFEYHYNPANKRPVASRTNSSASKKSVDKPTKAPGVTSSKDQQQYPQFDVFVEDLAARACSSAGKAIVPVPSKPIVKSHEGYLYSYDTHSVPVSGSGMLSVGKSSLPVVTSPESVKYLGGSVPSVITSSAGRSSTRAQKQRFVRAKTVSSDKPTPREQQNRRKPTPTQPLRHRKRKRPFSHVSNPSPIRAPSSDDHRSKHHCKKQARVHAPVQVTRAPVQSARAPVQSARAPVHSRISHPHDVHMQVQVANEFAGHEFGELEEGEYSAIIPQEMPGRRYPQGHSQHNRGGGRYNNDQQWLPWNNQRNNNFMPGGAGSMWSNLLLD